MNIIDIHTHGIGGFDTRSSTAEDILRIAEIHGALGVSEIVLSIYPAPIKTMRQQMELVREAMERQGHGSLQDAALSRVQGLEKTRTGSEPPDSAVRPPTTRDDPRLVEVPGPRTLDPGPGRQARILGVH